MFLWADSPKSVGTATATPVTMHGQPGVVDGDTLVWSDRSGVALTVISRDSTPERLVDLADALAVTTIEALPGGGAWRVSGEPVTATPRIAGVIAGVPWSVNSAPDATAELSLSVNQRTHSSANGPRRDVASTWNVIVTGRGDGGTIIYGLAPGDVSTVRVDVGSAVALPVAHDDHGVAIYAIPVAPGLRLHQVSLVTDSGEVIQRADIPTLLPPSGGTHVFMDEPLDNTFPRSGT